MCIILINNGLKKKALKTTLYLMRVYQRKVWK